VFLWKQAISLGFVAFVGMQPGVFRNTSGTNYRQNAWEFGIGIKGNSKGIYGQALAMGAHLQNEGLQRVACGALDGIIRGDAQNQGRARHSGAVEAMAGAYTRPRFSTI
jgi:hypothetical protein